MINKKTKKNKIHSRKHTRKHSRKHSRKHTRKYSQKIYKTENQGTHQDTRSQKDINFFKTLSFEVPLLKYRVTKKEIEDMKNDKTENYKKQINKSDYNPNKNFKFNFDEFLTTYKMKNIEPSLSYLLMENYLLQKDKINYNSFFKIWNNNNFNLFHDLINCDDPYFKGKYDISDKYDFFIPYVYDINIYDDIYNDLFKNILETDDKVIKPMKSTKPIKILSPFMEDTGSTLHSILRLLTKFNVLFSGYTINKYAYNGFNEMVNLYDFNKLPIEGKYTNNIYTTYTAYTKYTSQNNKQPNKDNKDNNIINLFYGEYNSKDLPDNDLDIIITEMPNWNQFYIKLNSSIDENQYQKQYIHIFLQKCYNQLKNNGYLILHINTITRGNMTLINNIKNIVPNLKIINTIRLCCNDEIRDHDNFIIVLQKNQELDKNIDDTSNLSTRLIIKNFKLSPDRTIKIVYDNCKNITKNYFDCNNGYLQELDNKMDYAKYIDIKNQGYTKIIMILTYAPANYKSVFDSIKILGLELTVIFIMDYLNSQLSYILENMLYDLKNKYNFQVLVLNHDETDKYIDKIDKITTFIDYQNKISKDSTNSIIKIHREHLEPIFKNVKTVWFSGSTNDVVYLCNAFPEIEFKFLFFFHYEEIIETETILNYINLKLKNLKIYIPVSPFKKFPDIDYDSDNQFPNYVFYYSTFLKYAEDGDLVYSNYFLNYKDL